MNQAIPTSIPALSESIRSGHRLADRLDGYLSNILYELTGNGADAEAAATPSCGLLSDADALASRLGRLVDRVEFIRASLADQNEVKSTGTGIGSGGLSTRI